MLPKEIRGNKQSDFLFLSKRQQVKPGTRILPNLGWQNELHYYFLNNNASDSVTLGQSEINL